MRNQIEAIETKWGTEAVHSVAAKTKKENKKKSQLSIKKSHVFLSNFDQKISCFFFKYVIYTAREGPLHQTLIAQENLGAPCRGPGPPGLWKVPDLEETKR